MKFREELTLLSQPPGLPEENTKKTGQYRQNGNVTFLEVFFQEGNNCQSKNREKSGTSHLFPDLEVTATFIWNWEISEPVGRSLFYWVKSSL